MDLNQPLGDKIQINVGSSIYHIHEGLLRRDTKFFEIYEYGGFLNIDVGSDMFDSFAQWLYNRDLFKHPNGGVRVILELWFFAAKISCPELQNYAMDWIQDYHHSEDSMEESELRYVFETAKDGGGHKTLEDYCAAILRQKSAEDFEMVCDFLQEVPVALSSYLYYESSLLVLLGFATASMTDFKQLFPSIYTARQKIQIEVAGGCYVVHWEILAGAGLFESLRDDQVIVLDEEYETIDYFVQWLYTQGSFFKVPEIKTVLKLWIFANKMKLLRLQDYCMDFIQDHYLRNEKFMDLDELKYVFGATEGAHMNEMEGSTDVAYFLRTVPAAIVAYLDYETRCNTDSDNDPRSRERFPCEFHIRKTDNFREG
ncbi:hypothetical protein BGAL_0116g00260 [Botrytis galanthina]|uniref:BTB domain-containing protein n=1 Tax=Botrytis galanthina TaxID=278940 RepID=A0A4S8RCX9_9HELO|nr:hypothetical protein BGAL_0116g00260 [Botrytis galanthina]